MKLQKMVGRIIHRSPESHYTVYWQLLLS